jgi:hypothetical protein
LDYEEEEEEEEEEEVFLSHQQTSGELWYGSQDIGK